MTGDRSSAPEPAIPVPAGAFPGHTMQRIRTPDGAYRYGHVSASVREVFGLDADWLMAQQDVDHAWIHEADRDRWLDALERSAATLEPLDEEVRVLPGDGTVKWVRSMGRPRRLADGTTIWDGVAIDVTERHEALRALQRTLDEARQSEASGARIGWIVDHDVRDPLEALRRAVARLAARRGGTPEVDGAVAAFAAFDRAFAASKDLLLAHAGDTGSAFAKLTARQRQIAELIRQGLSNREIAARLDLTEGTVKLHVSAILKRLAARNRTDVARMLRAV